MVLGGAGYSFNFLGGLTLVNAHAPATHRAGMLSSVLVVAYLVQGAAALLLGAVATSGGLAVALDVGSPAIGVVCVAALVLVLVAPAPGRGRSPSDLTAGPATLARTRRNLARPSPPT